MNNGQINLVAITTAIPQVTLESTASAVAASDTAQQTGGNFAGMLSGLQLLAKEAGALESQHGAQMLFNVKAPCAPVTTENSVVDLLAQFHVSPATVPGSESEKVQTKDTEKSELHEDAALLLSKLPDVTSQMVMAAYSQAGRMPEVNALTELPVETLQNVATVSESPAVISTPASDKRTKPDAIARIQGHQTQEQAVVPFVAPPVPAETVLSRAAGPVQELSIPVLAVTATGLEKTTALKQETSGIIPKVNKVTQVTVDRLQDVAPLAELPQTTAPVTTLQMEQTVAVVKPDAVNIPSAPQAAPLQNVATAAEPHVVTIPAVTIAEQPVVTTAITENRQPHAEASKSTTVDRQPANPVMATVREVNSSLAVTQPETIRKTADVNIPSAPQTAPLQNVAVANEPHIVATPAVTTAEQPVITSATARGLQPQTETVKAVTSEVHRPPVNQAASPMYEPLQSLMAAKHEAVRGTVAVNILPTSQTAPPQNVAVANEPHIVTTPAVNIAEQPVIPNATARELQPHTETVKAAVEGRQAIQVPSPVYEPLQPLTVAKPESTRSTVAVNFPSAPQVAPLQNVVVAAEPHVVTTAAVTTAEQPAVTKAIVENQQPHAETLKTAAIDRQPAATEVMPEYEPLQLLTVAKPAATISAVAVNAQPAPQTASLPNVTKVAESPVTSTPVAKLRMEQAEVVTVPSAENKPAATPPEQPVEAVTAVQNQPQKIETVKAMPFADSRHDQTAVTPASTQAPLLATLSQESELDIQLSQPRPITARVTAAVVSSDSRIASQLQDIRGARQRPGSEPQNEKSRTVDEQNVVKELAPLLQSAVSASEPTFAASTFEGDNNQELPVGVIAGKQLAQDLPGQLSADHQKISTVISKPVSIESARQEIPERVMQQVKDRLVQHEVKAGNQQITLTLSPDSLGELKMNLNLQGQKLSVEIVTENRSVRDAIVQHSDALKESLARQNITMESFDVTTGGKGSGNSGTNQNAWREMAKQQQQQQFWTSPRGYNTAQTDLSSGQAYPKQPGHSMLDIHY